MISVAILILSCLTFVGIVIVGATILSHVKDDAKFQNRIVQDFAVIEEIRKRVDAHDDLFGTMTQALARIEEALKQVQDEKIGGGV